MKSMTGYGEATAQGKLVKVAAQLRTLNHRHLDIQLRVPKVYLSLEEEMRQRIRQRVSRGRVDLFLTRLPLKGGGHRLELDEGLLDQYLLAFRRAKRKFGLKGEMDISLLSRHPDLFRLREDEGVRKSERALVLRTVESALRNLDRSREREGRHLKLDILDQVHTLRRICTGLGRAAKKIQGELQEAERGALEHGNSLLKGDIHEEAVRLRSHVEGLSGLVRETEPVGKKFDFLLQEVQRELNTISSKAPHLSVVELVLAGKGRVEKIREQVQNVE